MTKVASREISARSVHIWLGSLPEWLASSSGEVLSRTVSSEKTSIGELRSAAMRLRFSNDHGTNGALGASFVPSDKPEIVIQVPLASSDEAEDEHRAGFLANDRDLAEAVISEAELLVKQRILEGQGILRFDRVFSHPVDSFPELYRALTYGVMSLLRSEVSKLSDEEILALVPKSLSDIRERKWRRDDQS